MLKRLKDNPTNILLVVFILSFSNAAFFLWYYSATNLHFNSSDFNNIFSPIATTATAIAFIYLAYQQNSIIVSQNLKPHIEKEFERIHRVLSKCVLESLGQECNTINSSIIIEHTLKKVNSNEEYQNDVQDFKSGILHDLEYFKKRTYYSDVKFLLTYSFFGILGFGSVEGFIDQIMSSKLHKDDKKAYLEQIKKEFVGQYMSVIHRIRLSGIDLVPDLNGNAMNLQFIHLLDSNFIHFYENFSERLYKEKR